MGDKALTSRERIIKTSIEVFARKNYNATRTRELAEAAGISEGALYKHFSSKKEIFLECARSIQGILLNRYRALYEECKDDPYEYLKRVALDYYGFAHEYPDEAKFLAFILANTFDPDIRAFLVDFIDAGLKWATRMIERSMESGAVKKDIDPASVAWLYVGGYYTIILAEEMGQVDPANPTPVLNCIKAIFE
jgi:AcrR family transcriptional regulator